LSARVTTHSAAVTWGWARWFVFAGLIAAALWVGGWFHDGNPLDHLLSGATGAVVAVAAAFAFPRCPRCNHHLFGRNEDGSRRFLRPRQRCGKCNLDLTRYAPGDPRAKKE
jgi:hypothetical protein